MQSFIGVRYSDLFRIKPENIEEGWLKIKPSKTKRYEVEVNQPITQYAIDILKKYDYDTSSLYIANQPYNREIKDMFQVMVKEYPDMKYRTDYRSHSCRDTYISICVEAGVNWKSILNGWNPFRRSFMRDHLR